ncbi:MAG: hypothetical protein ACYTGC_14170, partial [Planctomycetota bacterium]
ADDPATADTGCGVPVVVDMGAYEFQGEPVEVDFADLTGDGFVGLDDFDTLVGCWSSSDGPCCVADLDLDGVVGVVDFLILLTMARSTRRAADCLSKSSSRCAGARSAHAGDGLIRP